MKMSDEFLKIFHEVSSSHNPSKIYEEWLDYVIDINLLQLESQDLDFQGREADYFRLFESWIKIMNDKNHTEKLEDTDYGHAGKDWYDYLGYFYQNHIQSQSGKQGSGSFYTPANVCSSIAEMTLVSTEDYKDKLIRDPCCGSGRMLLAGHSFAPEAIFIGGDLDLIAVKQTVLNFWIHGVTGSVCHMDGITDEFMEGWKVNQYLNHGLPVPHIEKVYSYEEAVYFFGRNTKSPEEYNIKDEIDVVKTKKTVQSTLI